MNKILCGFLIIGMICSDVEGLQRGKRVFDEASCGRENPTLSRLSEAQPVEDSSPVVTVSQPVNSAMSLKTVLHSNSTQSGKINTQSSVRRSEDRLKKRDGEHQELSIPESPKQTDLHKMEELTEPLKPNVQSVSTTSKNAVVVSEEPVVQASVQSSEQADFPEEVSAVTDKMRDYFVGIWQGVSPVIRCPIEFCVHGFRYIYARNKVGAFVALAGTGSAVAFAIWSEYRCLSMYDSFFCNPFSTPSLKYQVAHFFGL
ncbi:MAG: hypothetical protein K6C34_05015 [Alphaproteobacteria bacterium]|nr:hypothetical protein [Alphaproteobacteria bacterium]